MTGLKRPRITSYNVCYTKLLRLNLIYKIPVLVIMSWRGHLGKDAPEHIIRNNFV